MWTMTVRSMQVVYNSNGATCLVAAMPAVAFYNLNIFDIYQTVIYDVTK